MTGDRLRIGIRWDEAMIGRRAVMPGGMGERAWTPKSNIQRRPFSGSAGTARHSTAQRGRRRVARFLELRQHPKALPRQESVGLGKESEKGAPQHSSTAWRKVDAPLFLIFYIVTPQPCCTARHGTLATASQRRLSQPRPSLRFPSAPAGQTARSLS
ncbi:hypothetical protein L1887_47735 [Cichorium endivia]|nr:hypothetical protein L1887_47735 [Cichorium endivia]